MSEIAATLTPSTPPIAEPAPATKPVRQWRKAATRMDPEQAHRQGAAASSAFRAFGERDRVLAFLNEVHVDLGERPIDVAIASEEGLAEVERLIDAESAR